MGLVSKKKTITSDMDFRSLYHYNNPREDALERVAERMMFEQKQQCDGDSSCQTKMEHDFQSKCRDMNMQALREKYEIEENPDQEAMPLRGVHDYMVNYSMLTEQDKLAFQKEADKKKAAKKAKKPLYYVY